MFDDLHAGRHFRFFFLAQSEPYRLCRRGQIAAGRVPARALALVRVLLEQIHRRILKKVRTLAQCTHIGQTGSPALAHHLGQLHAVRAAEDQMVMQSHRLTVHVVLLRHCYVLVHQPEPHIRFFHFRVEQLHQPPLALPPVDLLLGLLGCPPSARPLPGRHARHRAHGIKAHLIERTIALLFLINHKSPLAADSCICAATYKNFRVKVLTFA